VTVTVKVPTLQVAAGTDTVRVEDALPLDGTVTVCGLTDHLRLGSEVSPESVMGPENEFKLPIVIVEVPEDNELTAIELGLEERAMSLVHVWKQ